MGIDPRRVGLRVSGAVSAVVLVLAALVFSNSIMARQVINDGVVLHRAEAVLGANDLAFKAAGQAVLLAEDRQLGVADDDTVEMALHEARDTITELETRVDELVAALGGEDQGLRVAAGRVGEASGELFALIEASQVDQAGSHLSGEVKPVFEDLRDTAVMVRDTSAIAVSAADGLMGNIANLTSFLVAFLLPAGVILTYRFVTRRQMRMARTQLEARVLAEQRIHQAKDEFIANLSHELRTPLTSIYGFSEVLLEQGVIDPETALDLIGVINKESADLARMVDDLLVAARIDAAALTFEPQAVDIASESETVLSPFRRAGLNIAADLPSVEVWADPLRLRQILRNLISNAHKHGGPTIRLTARIQADQVICLVADDGPGVPPDIEPRLFTRFVHEGKAPLTVGSVGLGLAMAKALVDAMGGEIGYQRVYDWTVFTISLPLAAVARPDDRDESAHLPEDAAPAHSAPAGQRR